MNIFKKIAKVLLIIILIVFVATLPLKLPILSLMLTNNSFGFEKGAFSRNIDAFEDTVEWVLKIAEENPNDDYICIGIDGYKSNYTAYLINPEKGDIKLSKHQKESLKKVSNAFTSMDNEYSFDCIRVKNGVISFDIVDGRYSVIYAQGKSKRELDCDNGKKIKRINNCWYHKKSGYSSFWDILGVLTGIAYIT